MNDSTADLTDDRLAAAAAEAWNRANMCLDGGLPDRRAAALRAVAALARQGWAPAPDAPDHIAGGSNMVASSALPSDVEQALIDAESALGDIAEGRASEPPTVPPVVKDSLTTAPALPADVAELVQWLNSTGELAGSADIEESKRYWRAAELLQQRHPAPVAVSERPWEHQPGWLDSDGECWWCPPEGPPYWQMANPAMVYGGWVLPASALLLPAGEAQP